MMDLPNLDTILLERSGRRLTITLNRPEMMNAFGAVMHKEIVTALRFAAEDETSDVVVITGAGRAFSAGGDIGRMQHFVDHPDDFAEEAEGAKRLVFALLEIEKPVIARINGPAVGLGATIALFCDVAFACETAKIGDPHVSIGLVAGDGGAVIWPQLVGFHRAKEFLLTGDLLTATEAAKIGLINHAVPEAELDTRVDAYCDKLLKGAQQAIRWTKVTMNIELKRIAHALMDPGLAYESLTIRSDEHRKRVDAFVRRAGKKP
jgi:enoyl-CoA hydratase